MLNAKNLHTDRCGLCGYWWKCLDPTHLIYPPVRGEVVPVEQCLHCVLKVRNRGALTRLSIDGNNLRACRCGGLGVSEVMDEQCYACAMMPPSLRSYPLDPRLLPFLGLPPGGKKRCKCNKCHNMADRSTTCLIMTDEDWKQLFPWAFEEV